MAILCVGRSTFDLGHVCAEFPREDEKISGTRSWAMAGGPALNAAVTAQALGSEVRLATLLGSGPFADAVAAELAAAGVAVEDFAAPGAQVLPVSSIVIVPAHGSRTVIDQQPPQELARPVGDLLALEGIELLLTDGFLPDLAIPLCREARRRGVPVVFDGGSWKPWTGEILPHVDCAIVSERFHPNGTAQPDVIAAIHAFGPAQVAVTRGERALTWSDGQQRDEIVPPMVEAIDTLGAGDVFHGAYCHFAAAGSDFATALEQAAAVAARSCGYFGTRGWIAEWAEG